MLLSRLYQQIYTPYRERWEIEPIKPADPCQLVMCIPSRAHGMAGICGGY